MVTVCQTCGDEGLSGALTHCDKCKVYAVHLYCLPTIPADFDEDVTWLCEDCEPKVVKASSMDKPNPFLVRENDRESLESPPVKKRNLAKGLEEKSRKKCGACLDTESEVLRLENNSSLRLPEVRYFENSKKDQRREDELHGSSFNEVAESLESENFNDGQLIEVGFHEAEFHKATKSQVPILDPEPLQVYCYGEKNKVQKLEILSALDEGSSHDKTEYCKAKRSQLTISRSLKLAELSYFDCAKPIRDPIWRGSLNISNKKSTLGGLVAHLSSFACSKAIEEAKSFSAVLSAEMLSRSALWPKSFQRRGPNDTSIALYFFPDNQRSENIFDSLVDDMIHKDHALRVYVENAQLLIFTSTVLPMEYRRFQAKFNMWGVFRGKHPSHLAISTTSEEEKGLPLAITWDSPSPASPLSSNTLGFWPHTFLG